VGGRALTLVTGYDYLRIWTQDQEGWTRRRAKWAARWTGQAPSARCSAAEQGLVARALPLEILNQGGLSPDPMGDDFDYAEAFNALDYRRSRPTSPR
jgi:catalase (peroxidase I)